MPATTLRFYEFPEAFQAVLDQTEEHGGELTPELEAELEALEGSFAEKADRIAGARTQEESAAASYKAEADRLLTLAKAHANKAESLKRYLHKTMVVCGYDKLKTAHFAIRVQQNSQPSVRYDGDLDKLPAEFLRIKAELDAKAVLEASKEGRAIPEGIQIVRGNHIVIR